MRILIVGAGLYGAVCAHELGKAGHQCRVIEKRDHVGGNIFTRYNEEAQCHEHVYGAHIFHTNNTDIWNYMNRFTEFNNYVNRVKVNFRNKIYSFPINLMTISQIFGSTNPQEAMAAVEQDKIKFENFQNMEEFCLNAIGQKMYATFIEGYTKKQWGRHPRDLPADIVKRLPVRYNFDDNYFNDKYQGIPIGGYTAIISRMFGETPIELGIDFFSDREKYLDEADLVIYTGSIDAFFDYKFGVLEYRSLRFEREIVPVGDFQGNAVINYTEESVPYTRIIEHKHFDMNYKSQKTLITREYPDEWGVGKTEYYPINDAKNNDTYNQYKSRTKSFERKVHFGGRLGEYKYYDMHQVVGAALKFCKSITG